MVSEGRLTRAFLLVVVVVDPRFLHVALVELDEVVQRPMRYSQAKWLTS